MTKATMKSLLMTAAMSGLLTGATTTLAASTTSNPGRKQHQPRARTLCLVELRRPED